MNKHRKKATGCKKCKKQLKIFNYNLVEKIKYFPIRDTKFLFRENIKKIKINYFSLKSNGKLKKVDI